MDEELNVDLNDTKEPAQPDTEFVEAETKKCRFCGRLLHSGFDFCTYCGKSQKDIPAIRPIPEREAPKRAPEIKAAPKNGSVLFSVFAMIAFSVAFFFLVIAFIDLGAAGASTSSSAFGGFFQTEDNSELIRSAMYAVSYLLTSLIFTVTGFFLLILKKLK